MTISYKLKSPLGRSYSVREDDTQAVKNALAELGYLKAPKQGLTPYPNEEFFKAIEHFQLSNGLKVDGVMKPGGETETALAAGSYQYRCTACGVLHGEVFSTKLCSDCFTK